MDLQGKLSGYFRNVYHDPTEYCIVLLEPCES